MKEKILYKTYGLYTKEEEEEILECYSEQEEDEKAKFDFMSNFLEDDWQSFEYEVSKLMEGKEYIIKGSLGLWNGRHTIIPTKAIGFEAIRKCLNKSEDYKIIDNDGRLIILAYHHDGTNEFEIREAKYNKKPRIAQALGYR